MFFIIVESFYIFYILAFYILHFTLVNVELMPGPESKPRVSAGTGSKPRALPGTENKPRSSPGTGSVLGLMPECLAQGAQCWGHPG